MKKRALSDFENGFLLLIFLLILQQLSIYIQVGLGQPLTLDTLILSLSSIFSIAVGYFLGMKAAIGYSLIYIITFVFYLIIGRYDIELFHYIWFFFIPFSSVSSAFINLARNQMYEDAKFLEVIKEETLYIDPTTKLMTDNVMYDVLLKHTTLAHRYEAYHFSIMMIRIEFLETIKFNLGTHEFQSFLNELSIIIRSTLRIEDYKFLIKGEQFIIIFPMTPLDSLQIVKSRIMENVDMLQIHDKNERVIKIVLKTGILEYSEANHNVFINLEQLLTSLERKTDEDIYAEYNM